MADPLLPPEPRRWPTVVAVVASLVWLLGLGAQFATDAGLIELPRSVAGLVLLVPMMGAPVAVVWLAMLQLRDAGAVSAVRAEMADARSRQAAEWLEHSAEALRRLEEQLAATTARMAAMEAPVQTHADALAGAAARLDAANARLAETAGATVAAGRTLAELVPQAEAQAQGLLELLARTDNQLRAQMAETETLLASLYTRASEAEAQARAAAETSRREISALGEASQSGLNAVASAAEEARAAVSGPIGDLNTAVNEAFTRTAEAVDSARSAVNGQTAALLASVEQARTALAHIGGEAARELDERLGTLQALADAVARRISDSSTATAALVDDLGGRIAALEARLGDSIARNSDAAAGLDARLADASATAAALANPLGDAATALETMEARLAALQAEAAGAMALLDDRLPHNGELVGALEARLEALRAAADALALPMAEGSNAMDAAGSRLAMAREALALSSSELATAIAAAEEKLRSLEQDTSRLSLTASGELIETFGRVREVAGAAAGAMRTALAGVISEAEEALDRSATERAEAAFAAPIRARIEELATAQARAGETAQLAAERVTKRLLGLVQTLAEVEARVDAVEARGEAKARNALGRRANLLIDQLHRGAVDLVGLLAFDLDDRAWGDYAAGDRSAIARRLVEGLDNGAGRQFARHYAHDADFRAEAARFIADFEALVAEVVPEQGGEALGATLLSSTLGKLYLALGQAAGRFV